MIDCRSWASDDRLISNTFLNPSAEYSWVNAPGGVDPVQGQGCGKNIKISMGAMAMGGFRGERGGAENVSY